RKALKSALPLVRLSFVEMTVNVDERELFREKFAALADWLVFQNYLNLGQKPQTAWGLPQAKAPKRCLEPLTRLALMADGGLFPCCSDFGRLAPLGVFPRQSLAEVWTSPAALVLGRPESGGPCRLCLAASEPDGGRGAERDSGRGSGRDPGRDSGLDSKKAFRSAGEAGRDAESGSKLGLRPGPKAEPARKRSADPSAGLSAEPSASPAAEPASGLASNQSAGRRSDHGGRRSADSSADSTAAWPPPKPLSTRPNPTFSSSTLSGPTFSRATLQGSTLQGSTAPVSPLSFALGFPASIFSASFLLDSFLLVGGLQSRAPRLVKTPSDAGAVKKWPPENGPCRPLENGAHAAWTPCLEASAARPPA
ncbi:MAG: hypothetical protein LBU12_06150, partial [Deltaproteobacteria bacterium]|nr:hypothetical protein [Deltaproteobacteria bacterium]